MDTTTLTRSDNGSRADAELGIAPDLLATLVEEDLAADRDGTYVGASVERLRDAGWLALPVPSELGGAGLTTAGVAAQQRALARHAPNVALVTSMHHHVVLLNAFRWRRGAAPPEAMLRKVAEDGIFVASTGGNDFLAPSGEARPVDGGFLVSGRKPFCSGALSAAAFSTWVMSSEPSPETGEPEALAMAVPASAEGVTIDETWDAVGMRGTGSHDAVFADVFVPEAAVAMRRPLGVVHPSLQAITVHALPVIMSVYLGVAEGGRDRTVEVLAGRGTASPGAQRAVGEIDRLLAVADWTLRGVLGDIGDDPTPTEALFVRTMLAKATIAAAVGEAADRMMEAVGGAAYSRRLPVERTWRDLRAAPYHPISHEQALMAGGGLALDQPLL